MNFISNVLDSIPVVGHVKGIVHYAVGDDEGGHKAMYQSTRTTAVLAGGAVGSIAGPGGAVAVAMYAGLATDGVASIAMDKTQGIFESCENIGKDISAGRNPAGSILSTGMQLGFDAVGGLGMSGVAGAAGKVSEKAAAKTAEAAGKKMAATLGEEMIEKSVQLTAEEMTKLVGKKAAKEVTKEVTKKVTKEVTKEGIKMGLVTAHVLQKAAKQCEEDREAEAEKRREAENKARKEKERAEKEAQKKREEERRANQEKTKPNSGTGSGSGQPPRRDKDDDKKSKGTNEPDFFEIFMKLLRKLLTLIYGNADEPFTRIFDNLKPGQRRYLEGDKKNNKQGVIERLMKSGTLDEVIEVTIRIFKEYLSHDVSFPNFLSILEIVQTYVLDELNERILISRGNTTGRPRMTYKERRAKILSEIFSETDIVKKIVALIKKLGDEIKNETKPPNGISPDYRDIYAAIYHYLKHRCVPGDGTLTVKEYYDWIRKILKDLLNTKEYAAMIRSRSGRLRYEVYIVMFNRRFRIIVSIENGEIVLNSAFVVTAVHPDDKDGDIFIYKEY